MMLRTVIDAGATVGGDPRARRIVYATVIALVLIGVALVILAMWLFRSTKVDRALLSPLETMSDRKWRRLDPASQRRLLDEQRPEGAEPLHIAPIRPPVDAEFEAGTPDVEGFDDLVDDRTPADADTGEGSEPLDDTTAMDRPDDDDVDADVSEVDDADEDADDDVSEVDEDGNDADDDVSEVEEDGDDVDGDDADDAESGEGASDDDGSLAAASDTADSDRADPDMTPPTGADSLAFSDDDAPADQ